MLKSGYDYKNKSFNYYKVEYDIYYEVLNIIY